MKLGTKFVLTAIALTGLSIAIVGAIGFSLGRRGIETHTDLHLQSVVALASDKITGWIELQRAMANSDLYPRGETAATDRLLSSAPGTSEYDDATKLLEQYMMNVGVGPNALQDLLLLDSQGRVNYSSIPTLPSEATLDWLNEQGFSGFYVGLTREVPGTAESPLLVFAEPVRGAQTGVVVVYVDPKPLQELLVPDAAMGARGRLYLVESGRGVVTHNRVMHDSPGGAMTILEGVGSGSNSTFVASDGLEMVGQALQLPDLPWKLVAAVPTEDAFADVREMRLLMTLALIAIGAAAGLAAWRFSITITGPLKKVVSGAQAIGTGDLDYRIPVGSADEVGELASSFNEMARNLAESRSELVRAERKIAFQEMSERVLQAVPISLVVCDEDGRVLSANSEFYRTFSLTPNPPKG